MPTDPKTPPQRFIARIGDWLEKLPLAREGKFWLLFSLALLGTGLFRSINLINLLASFLIATLVYNLWLARRQVRALHGRRILEEAFFAKTPAVIVLEVYNRRSRTVNGLQLHQQGQVRPIASLAGRQATHVAIPLQFSRRGRHTLGPFTVSSGFPLGLADWRRALIAEEDIVVLPQLGTLRRGVLRRHLQMHSPTVGQARTVPRRHPSAQTDFHGMRSFQPGDSPRWIHWRTTARRGELMVKEFEETPSDNLILIVDPYFATNSPDRNLEEVLSLAATICWEWCRQKGDRLVLAIAGADPIVRAGVTSSTLALEQLRHLALEPGCDAANVPRLLEHLLAAELPAAPVLVVSAHGCEFLEELQQGLHRAIAAIDVSVGDHQDFYGV